MKTINQNIIETLLKSDPILKDIHAHLKDGHCHGFELNFQQQFAYHFFLLQIMQSRVWSLLRLNKLKK